MTRKSEVIQGRISTVLIAGGLAVLVGLLLIASVVLGVQVTRAASNLPDIRLLETWRPNESTRIYDRYGSVIANIHGDEDRVVVPLEGVSPYLPRAIMAIEDNRFYQHDGVDVRGTVRALFSTLVGKEVQGGSTITQQLVKNLYLTPERSLTRKIAEALLSLRVEQYYEKNRIMELYLNQVYWGNHAYGAEKAARKYFKKSASELTLAQSALLAGLLKAPEGLSPYRFPEAAMKRQRLVLDAMVRYGYITEDQRRVAEKEELTFSKTTVKPSRFPYFVSHVISELTQEFGEDLVRRGGLRVYTTLDQKVQAMATKTLKEAVNKLPDTSQVTQGALVSVNVDTGEIMALVGGLDWSKSQFNTVTQARRAAGSTFKPIVYLTGFRLGMITPNSRIADKRIRFGYGPKAWSPKNWDGQYWGTITIRKALSFSRNTPTVQIGQKVGLDEVLRTAKLAGIESKIDPNLASLLGASGVAPLEMVTVYSTFARGGIKRRPYVVQKVEDARGRRLQLADRTPRRVFDSDDVAMLNSVLQDVVKVGTGKRAQLPDRAVAGKTGTTDKTRDVWFAGFTPDMATVVWLGNDRYQPLKKIYSSNAAIIWHDFAEQYYSLKPTKSRQFSPPPEQFKTVQTTVSSTEKPSTLPSLPPLPSSAPPSPLGAGSEATQQTSTTNGSSNRFNVPATQKPVPKLSTQTTPVNKPTPKPVKRRLPQPSASSTTSSRVRKPGAIRRALQRLRSKQPVTPSKPPVKQQPAPVTPSAPPTPIGAPPIPGQ